MAHCKQFVPPLYSKTLREHAMFLSGFVLKNVRVGRGRQNSSPHKLCFGASDSIPKKTLTKSANNRSFCRDFPKQSLSWVRTRARRCMPHSSYKRGFPQQAFASVLGIAQLQVSQLWHVLLRTAACVTFALTRMHSRFRFLM